MWTARGAAPTSSKTSLSCWAYSGTFKYAARRWDSLKRYTADPIVDCIAPIYRVRSSFGGSILPQPQIVCSSLVVNSYSVYKDLRNTAQRSATAKLIRCSWTEILKRIFKAFGQLKLLPSLEPNILASASNWLLASIWKNEGTENSVWHLNTFWMSPFLTKSVRTSTAVVGSSSEKWWPD